MKKLELTKDYQDLTTGSILLLLLLHTGKLIDNISSLGSLKRAVYPDLAKHHRDKNFNQLVSRLEKQGYIKKEYKETKRIIKLTKRGELQAIFKKEQSLKLNTKAWNGEWSLISFDIPERASSIRVHLRRLLYTYGFKAMQASVYISPQQLPESAWKKLKESGLDRYICAIQATKISRQKTFERTFNLKRSKAK